MEKIKKTSLKTLMVFGLLFALACSKSDKVKLKIGQLHQGGTIFWLDATGKHGLVADTEDLSTAIKWGNYDETGATDTAIGTGKSNTQKILATYGTAGDYAANLCKKSKRRGFEDWFLPSKDELNELYKNKELIGGFANEWYWSSSEHSMDSAWGQRFSNGHQYIDNFKKETYRVRAVRAF